AQVFEGRRVDRRLGRRAGHLARPAERVEQHAAARQTRSEGARPHACATRARPPAHTACRLTLRVRPAVQAAMTPDPRAIHPQSRMRGGGRLSFRRRVREVEDDGTLPCILGGEDPPPLRDLVRGNPTAIEIEVGPGKGTFLLAAAQNRPDTFLVGIEASVAYAKFAAQRVRDAGLRNAVLLVDNARLYLQDRVPEGALRAVHVYYPDPWPKRRHRKRRFFVEETPDVLYRCLAPDGYLLVATDNAAYAGQIVA